MVDLCQLQKEIVNNKRKQGFNTVNLDTEFLLAYGEVTEAYNAWRFRKEDLGEEIADVAIYLLGISELLDINLEEEICKKIEKNSHRKYQFADGVPVRVEG